MMKWSKKTALLGWAALLAGCGGVVDPGNNQPQASISSPDDGWIVRVGDNVTLTGSGTDTEDGQLSGAALEWRSSLDGELGSGAQLVVSTLRDGEHEITLTARDGAGARGTASIELTVLPPLPANIHVAVPLTDMTSTDRYRGFEGLLYDGSNSPPETHATEGASRGDAISGTAVLMSVGMSNTRDHFDDFIQRVASDGSLSSDLVVVNGAQGGQALDTWDSPGAATYDVAESRLTAAGVSEADVVAIWMLHANRQPSNPLPASNADAYLMVQRLGQVLRIAQARYPNLRQVFFSTRIYSCATSGLSPEPFAHESAYAVKWLIQAQIDQVATGVVDPLAGDLDYRTGVAPWIAWGPYVWADGDNPRNDGLFWVRSDLTADCVHPTATATAKVAQRLLTFFKTSVFTTPWFLP